MGEEKIRAFNLGGSSVEQQMLVERHRRIADNVSLVISALERMDDKILSGAAAEARRLVDEQKALLWLVEDPYQVYYIAATVYILPNPEENGIIPAIVVDGSLGILLESPTRWDEGTRRAVVDAIINLPSAYIAALGFSQHTLLSGEAFFTKLEVGDPTRQRIIPIRELVR
ncbi:MAG: hypothetical protein AAB694_00105 [Patescibacteria group bacterium]